jgi:hypothetical protein
MKSPIKEEPTALWLAGAQQSKSYHLILKKQAGGWNKPAAHLFVTLLP